MTDASTKQLSLTLDKYLHLTSHSKKLVVENCIFQELAKDDFLIKIHKIDSNEYFLLEGILSRNVMNEDGEVVTAGFYMSPMVITPHFARTVNDKSIFNIQAMTPVLYANIPVAVFDSFRYSYDDFKAFGLKVLEQELINTMENEISYRALSAKERLLVLRHKYPNLENLVAHTAIASFLGVKPISFSRLRKEIAS